MSIVSGFSKLNREERIGFLLERNGTGETGVHTLREWDSPVAGHQQVLEDLIENYVATFPLPMGIVPNMLVNGELMTVPFVTEESSVVAAASKAAGYWAARGGFHASVASVTKKGQVHFTWNGQPGLLKELFPSLRGRLFQSVAGLTARMEQRGGGIKEISLIDKTKELAGYYQLDVDFETADAMGANFINSCLEKMGGTLGDLPELNSGTLKVEIILAILSNYSPDCRVNCYAECPVDGLAGWDRNLTGAAFAKKFKQAVDIAQLDLSRAVTHNKGIFNGIDAVLLATGNDWRATAAAGHAYAAASGRYQSLTSVSLNEGVFRCELEMPLTVGTVGGITQIHPLAGQALSMLQHPDARKLMMIASAAGLASNFAAVASLITTGIQQGHMKMHLANILNQLKASQSEQNAARSYFDGRKVSYSAVEDYIMEMRNSQGQYLQGYTNLEGSE